MKKNRPSFLYLDWWTDDYCFRFVILIITAIVYPFMLNKMLDAQTEINFYFGVSIILALGCSTFIAVIIAIVYEIIMIFFSFIFKKFKFNKKHK